MILQLLLRGHIHKYKYYSSTYRAAICQCGELQTDEEFFGYSTSIFDPMYPHYRCWKYNLAQLIKEEYRKAGKW